MNAEPTAAQIAAVQAMLVELGRPSSTDEARVLLERLRREGPREPLPQRERVQLEHTSEVLENVHRGDECAGPACAIHRRTEHSMRSFRQHWRSDRGIMERICPHGIGHPDPDAPRPAGDPGVHGCDGCCARQ